MYGDAADVREEPTDASLKGSCASTIRVGSEPNPSGFTRFCASYCRGRSFHLLEPAYGSVGPGDSGGVATGPMLGDEGGEESTGPRAGDEGGDEDGEELALMAVGERESDGRVTRRPSTARLGMAT